MSDAWVWDMYRPARFVKNVRVLTFKDVNVEELDKPDLGCRKATSWLLSGACGANIGAELSPSRRLSTGCDNPARPGGGAPSWRHGSEGRPRQTG